MMATKFQFLPQDVVFSIQCCQAPPGGETEPSSEPVFVTDRQSFESRPT